MATMLSDVPGVRFDAELSAAHAQILTPTAVQFVAALARRFESQRQSLLAARRDRQEAIDNGRLPDFLSQTAELRASDWTVAPIPRDLQDRRVEITGPVDRKMIINALNSGASVFMADFEDSNAPTWQNCIEGQLNLHDAIRRSIDFTSPEGKHYQLNPAVAVLMVRPRGWHLIEKHMYVDDVPVSASLFDFGLFFFHNARALIESGTGPYFYLPKMESHLEARLWNEVFLFAQDHVGIPKGTIRATVLIETILAGFEMDEILYELRDHSAGLNCGRWDYIFSYIKKLRNRPRFVLPDRIQITMDRGFLKAYVELLIKTCHRRGIHAMGGMAAQIPIKGDDAANEAALERVRADKMREVLAGHDGTWVAHPALVPIARAIFDEHMPGANQIGRSLPEVNPQASNLLATVDGDITAEGLRRNVDVGLQYLAAWLDANGCVPIYHLMEDAATAEISRTQLWQWGHRAACIGPVRGGVCSEGSPITGDMISALIAAERKQLAHLPKIDLAARLFEDMVRTDDCPEFLTTVAYEYL
jgi:malate synthase